MAELKEVTGEFGKSIRWTELASGPWEEENSIFLGAEVHGILEDIRTNVGENDANIYEIFTVENGLISVWDTTVLKDKMKKIMVGSEVKIVYEGDVKPKAGGKAYKTFKVLYSESPDEDLIGSINALKLKEDMGGEEVL